MIVELVMFGIEVNKPLTLPDCAGVYTAERVCIMTDHGSWKEIHPGYVSWVRSVVVEQSPDGLVKELRIKTKGAVAHRLAIVDLTDRLGQPRSTSEDVVTNGFGAAVTRYNCQWVFDSGVSVSYSSVDSKINEGLVIMVDDLWNQNKPKPKSSF